MALLARLLDVAISTKAGAGAAGGTAAPGGATAIKLSRDLRMSAHISKAGGVADCTLDLKVFGLSLSLTNQLSTFGMQINLVQQTSIVLSAGDETNGMATVFTGSFVSAFADFAAPEVSFNIRAHTGFADAVISAAPTSFRGSVDVATVLSGLATKMGMRFENNGVTTKLADSYFPGTLREQARAVVRNAGIEWNGGDNGVLAIWPRGGSRGGQVPIVSPATGLEGYPTFTAYGVVLKTLLNPSIGLGGQIDLRSSIKAANAIYSVYAIDHDLESNVPGGRWHSTVSAYNPKLPQRPPVPVNNPVMS